MTALEAAPQMSNAVSMLVLDFAARRAGEEAVDRIRALASDARPREELADLTAWSSWAQGRALLEASAEVLGGSGVLRDVADDWARSEDPGELVTLLRSLGSPVAVLTAISAIAAKFSPVVAMAPLGIGHSDATIEAVTVPGFERYRELCDFTAGLLAVVPRIFGFAAGAVTEDRCVARGDDRCLYRVRWQETALDPDDEIAFLRGELQAMASRLEAFRQTARDLVSGQDQENLLATITRRAALAVRAPAYLLAVTADEDAGERVHHRGLAQPAVDALLAELRSRRVLDDPSRIVVEIASGDRHYGWLAALYPNGASFLPGEEPLLAAYAELAAAALDSATALARARREHATANALLELAADFATVTSASEVAERLLRATPKVVACDFATVYVHDRERGALVPTALHGFDDETRDLLLTSTSTADQTVVVEQLLHHPEPLFWDGSIDDPYLRPFLDAVGAAAIVSLPVVRQDTCYGVLSVGVHDRPERLRRDPDLVARLRGLANQAAAAFHNADLLQHVRNLALVDPLTELPNRIALAERTRRALAATERCGRHTCLLFLDLDGFKAVNDTLGHAAGDQLLRLVAERICGAVRAQDELARLGGDEFAILIADAVSVAEADAVAERVLAALRQPFLIGGREVTLTCSIGVATAHDSGQDFEMMLARADSAMYAAKRDGGGCHRTSAA